METFEVNIIFRLVNIDFEDVTEFQIDENLFLIKQPPAIIEEKYPSSTLPLGIREFDKPYWGNHSVEAQFKIESNLEEVDELIRVESIDRILNKILLPLLLSGICDNTIPYSTHSLIIYPGRRVLCVQGFNGYTFTPNKLNNEQLDRLKLSYNIIKESNTDNILTRSLDRYIIAKKEDLHHPNKVNQPNWDKIVDYVISLETIFLTTEKKSIKSEIGYRFKLNGVVLIGQLVDIDRIELFHVLGLIYDIRSRIVHGSEEKEILKSVEQIIEILKIDEDENRHGLGRLMILSKLLEKWLFLLFENMVKIPYENRPYISKGGWDRLILK